MKWIPKSSVAVPVPFALMLRDSPSFSSLGGASLAARASFIDTVDPRTRVVAAVVFSVGIAAADSLLATGFAVLTAIAGAILVHMRPRVVMKRLVPVNLFALVLVLLLPIATGHSMVFTCGPIHYSQEGLLLALEIALKANAIVLWMIVLLGSLDLITLGHALRHMMIPEKLVHLLLFSVRYVDVLHAEYLRLRRAMKMRGFRPRINAHTYRTFGFLVGMLLVRSLDRSERIVAAMKCRGFRGQFYLLDHFAFSRRDLWFVSAAILVLSLLAVLELS